ncbi:RsfA family transcriptional regulator [Bacillus sp. SD088]|uniref:RsfA family transcriptional regulator n=1 Tax=Bacillus sp. SD088 TaxID=2782012 RepID=UPI001A97C03D|nr:RsfA family transcriptional regulator [Bacillus sp. SD088]MBO0994265.1 RsfA family transcriptional regulator [Bacillus sp. SD088]
MTTSRQDAWSSDEDLLLAELVLSHIRKASTQLKAFEEAGKQLKRTAAACGFRWNSNIRKQYKGEINQAKKERKQLKAGEAQAITVDSQKSENASFEQQSSSSILANATSLLSEIEKELAGLDYYKSNNKRLKEEVRNLELLNIAANEEVKEMAGKYQQLKKDYHSLMYLLDKARKIADEFTEEAETQDVK